MGAFDEILDDLKVAPEDRAVLAPLAEKYPDLNAAVIRRKEYNQKLDEMDREKAARAKDFQELGEWRQVTKEFWDPEAIDPTSGRKGTWKQVAELGTKLTAAEQRAADLQKLVDAGGDMDFDGILNGLKEKGFVQKTDLTGLMPKSDYEADITKRLDTWGGSTEYMIGNVAPLVTRYAREYPGEDMDVTAFIRHTSTNDLWKDPKKAYESFTAGKRQELEVARLKKEAEDAEKRGYEKAKAEKQATHQPDDTSGNSPAAMGPLQARLKELKEGKKDDVSTGKLGDGSAAAAGMEALRNGTLVAP
jgi:hypothetical protein